MTFTINEGNFYRNGKKAFLNSGEIHYFRIGRELWDKHLEAARDAGLTTVSFYIPWAWHEPSQGFFDFTGETCPERDLVGWLNKCMSFGLSCIVKPGPFILAETRGAGLPDWFLQMFGDTIRMHNSKGQPVAGDGVALFHEKYLEFVELWYDQIMPLISQVQISNGGPVIMMQVCNEIGVFSWLAHQADYSPIVRDKFVNFLKKLHPSIDQLNNLWGANYDDFEQVELPPDGISPYLNPQDRCRDREWHNFWRSYYAEYLVMLTTWARDRGVTVPVYHNLPGWIYGSGYEFPVNITMYEELFGDRSELLFGVDHIPEYVSYRNMHDDRIINDITLAMQPGKPLFAAEFQCGSREYHVVTNPREMQLFYKASIANGLTGWNYYMFSQGKNPRHRGYSGDTFYWFNPLTAEGERTTLFPVISRMSRLLAACEDLIVASRRVAKICVLFYSPYYATELERPETGAGLLKFNPSQIRRPAYFDGLLKALQVLNIDYDMVDLKRAEPASLEPYRQVWVFSTDEMDAREQEVLVNYTDNGGNLIVFPCLPNRDTFQKSCTILQDYVGIEPSGIETIDSPLIDILGVEDVKCANPQVVFSPESLTGAEIIARTIQGSVCGFRKPYGKGTLLHLGTWIGFDTETHKKVYEAILTTSGPVVRKANASSDYITARQRFTDTDSALLFVANYYNEDHTGKVFYTHPGNGAVLSIPHIREEMSWPALYGILTPVCLDIAPGLEILHCTSDLLAVDFDGKILRMRLFGDRDLDGEILLEGPVCQQVISVSLDGKDIPLTRMDGRIVLNYEHKHSIEMILSIIL